MDSIKKYNELIEEGMNEDTPKRETIKMSRVQLEMFLSLARLDRELSLDKILELLNPK